MSSYILFSQTSTANGTRDKWGGAADSGGVTAPGNTVAGSSFSADKAGSSVLNNGAAQADYAADGVRKTAQVAMFDVSQTGAGAFTASAASAVNTLETQHTDGGNKMFAGNDSKLDTAKSDVDLASGKLWLALSDKNWNGIKNLEIALDSNATFRDIRLENFVDTRLKLGDDACDVVAKRCFDTFDVRLIGVKRGEVDASLATDNLKLEIDVWSNDSDWQNSFDVKGTAYGDKMFVGAGTVSGSSFGNKDDKAGYDGNGSYDGRFTKVFANLGAGDDRFESTNTKGDALKLDNGCKIEFRSVDKVWGGTGDDVVKTGGGDDVIFGDNGSGANFYADPASIAHEIGDNFLQEAIAGNFMTFSNPANLPAIALAGVPVDRGDYTITATGGNLIQLYTGAPATRAGGLGIQTGPDTTLEETEIDSRGGNVESLTFDFKTGAHSVEFDLSAFYRQEGPAGEVALWTANLVGGGSVSGSVTATQSTVPGLLSFAIGGAETGGALIDSVVLTGSLAANAFSDFYVAAIRACTVIPGAEGNDKLDGGTGADFIQGDGDTGQLVLKGAVGLDLICNGSFEQFQTDDDVETVIHDGASWYTFRELAIDNVKGWNTGNAAPIELQLGSTGGLAAFDGNVKLELDSHNDFGPASNAKVFQNVNALNGGSYDLSFAWSARADGVGSSAFEVRWNGQVVFSVDDDPNLAVGWHVEHINVTGAAGLDKLEFRGLGVENTFGAFIDDVSLTQKLEHVGLKSAGDQIWVGVDGVKDIVQFNTGDGFDVVRQFDTGEDFLRMQGTTASVTTKLVSTAEGLSTLVEDGAGGAVLLIGVTDPLTEVQDGLFVRLT